jgi:hypothetical protein
MAWSRQITIAFAAIKIYTFAPHYAAEIDVQSVPSPHAAPPPAPAGDCF